ncbi:MAG: tagaturonate reductase, partial [Clostridia bacterium]|nr:tagaturonate reductase [Clostridia bacterium]
LSSIALNSVSKFKVRVLPSLLEYIRRTGKTPPTLVCALAALIRFYKESEPNDDPAIMADMKALSVDEILARTDWWGEDLTFLSADIKAHL